MGFRLYRRKSLGQRFWLGLSKSGLSVAALVAGLVAVLALPSAATSTPTGRDGLIAFVSYIRQGEPRGLAVIRPDGGGFRQLTRTRQDSFPAWSPDGRRIAFEPAAASDDDDRAAVAFTRVVWLCHSCDVDRVFSANVDGSGVVWVIHEEGYVESRSPSWSPDGTLIVAPSGGLWIFTAAGERVRRLSLGSDPDWSR